MRKTSVSPASENFAFRFPYSPATVKPALGDCSPALRRRCRNRSSHRPSLPAPTYRSGAGAGLPCPTWVKRHGRYAICRPRIPLTPCNRTGWDRTTPTHLSVPHTSRRGPSHKPDCRRSNPVRPSETKGGAFCCRTLAPAGPRIGRATRTPFTPCGLMTCLTHQD